MKIARTFVRKEAYTRLLNWILEGTLPPGVKIRDKELAEQLGVSRTPIREALLRLEDEGFIYSKPNKATHVSEINFHDAHNLFSIVQTLESLALTQAFPSITPLHHQQMACANASFLKAMQNNNRLEALNADLAFHTVFIELAENPELTRILSETKHKLHRLDLYYYSQIKDADTSHTEHEQLIEALEKNDLKGALKALENNWKNSLSRLGGVNHV